MKILLFLIFCYFPISTLFCQGSSVTITIEENGKAKEDDVLKTDIYLVKIDSLGKNIYHPIISSEGEFTIDESVNLNHSVVIVKIRKKLFAFSIHSYNYSGKVGWNISIHKSHENDFKLKAELQVESFEGLIGVGYYSKVRRYRDYKKEILKLLTL